MGDEKQISFPDGGMVASGMSTHPCNKADYHYKVKDLTRQLSEARRPGLCENCDRLQDELA